MRGIAELLVLLALPAAQDSKEERGRYRLSVSGREAGREDYRLERFESGKTVLFSSVRFEIEIAGKKTGFVVDAALTMGEGLAPQLYAGYHKGGLDEKILKIEWSQGRALTPEGKAVATTAPFVLDANTVTQLIPILRRRDPALKKVRVFRPQAMAEADLAFEDRGEVTLAGPGRELRARELKLSTAALDFVVHVDGGGRLLRVHVAQTELLAELEGFEGLRPLPPLPEGVLEEELAFGVLAGTLARPRAPGKVPGVLILSGSGPQDRDGNVVRGRDGLERFAWEGPDSNLYREIARALAASGRAVLRYDDRGCGKSGGHFASASYAQLVADARSALDALRARADVGVVTLIGHGEGGVIAAELAGAAEGGPLVLLATPGRTLDGLLLEHAEDLLRAQGANEALIPEILAKERAVHDRIRSAEGDWVEIDERRTWVGWMKGRFLADPARLLKAARAPRTILFHGTRDESVPVSHADLLFAARSGVEVHKPDGLDHVFRRTGGPVDPAFLNALVEALK